MDFCVHELKCKLFQCLFWCATPTWLCARCSVNSITTLCLEYSILPRGAEYYVNSMNNDDNCAAEVFPGIIGLHSSFDVYSHNPSSSSRQQKNSAPRQCLAPAVLWSAEHHAHVCFHPYTVFTSSVFAARQTQQERHLVTLIMHSAVCLFQTLQQSKKKKKLKKNKPRKMLRISLLLNLGVV